MAFDNNRHQYRDRESNEEDGRRRNQRESPVSGKRNDDGSNNCRVVLKKDTELFRNAKLKNVAGRGDCCRRVARRHRVQNVDALAKQCCQVVESNRRRYPDSDHPKGKLSHNIYLLSAESFIEGRHDMDENAMEPVNSERVFRTLLI